MNHSTPTKNREADDWTNKQKEAFVKIQNEILSTLELTNMEVAEMFSTFDSKEQVFTLFRFTTSRWITELKIKPYYKE